MARKCRPMNQGPPFRMLSTSSLSLNLIRKKIKSQINAIHTSPWIPHTLKLRDEKRVTHLPPKRLDDEGLIQRCSHTGFITPRKAHSDTAILCMFFLIVKFNIFMHGTSKAKGFLKCPRNLSHQLISVTSYITMYIIFLVLCYLMTILEFPGTVGQHIHFLIKAFQVFSLHNVRLEYLIYMVFRIAILVLFKQSCELVQIMYIIIWHVKESKQKAKL